MHKQLNNCIFEILKKNQLKLLNKEEVSSFSPKINWFLLFLHIRKVTSIRPSVNLFLFLDIQLILSYDLGGT